MPVPETLQEALTPEWLTTALVQLFPGVQVKTVTPGPVIARVSTNARFEIDGDLPDALPRQLCIKGYFADTSGTGAGAAGEPEVRFYRDLAGWSGVRTLECIYAEIDSVTRHGVVITGDVAVRGATFLDALSPYRPDQAVESLDQYAVLHGTTWAAPQVGQPDWLASRIALTFRARGLPEIRGNFEGPIGARVPPEVRDPERLVEATRLVARMAAEAEPWCLLHGDAHIGNLYLDGEGRPCLVDWQLVQRGPWYLDVGYHLGCAVSVEDRRRVEDDLLAGYLEALRRRGVEPPGREEARRGVCAGLVYGFFLWAITLKVKPPITTAMLERLGAAVADHDAFGVVERAAAEL
jgi:hypothetical protein